MREIYKSLHKINPEIMWDIFKQKNMLHTTIEVKC